jgi:hypothetical protein
MDKRKKNIRDCGKTQRRGLTASSLSGGTGDSCRRLPQKACNYL